MKVFQPVPSSGGRTSAAQTHADADVAPSKSARASRHESPASLDQPGHSLDQMAISASPNASATSGAQGEENRPSRTEPDRTGLPRPLKSGIERLSGFAMNDVRVHYNSSKPERLGARAYAEGRHIHVGPGQNRHLPHEAWHVVQQKQGRVKPTLQMKGLRINDTDGLEREATTMGTRALAAGEAADAIGQTAQSPPLRDATAAEPIIQCDVGFEFQLRRWQLYRQASDGPVRDESTRGKKLYQGAGWHLENDGGDPELIVGHVEEKNKAALNAAMTDVTKFADTLGKRGSLNVVDKTAASTGAARSGSAAPKQSARTPQRGGIRPSQRGGLTAVQKNPNAGKTVLPLVIGPKAVKVDEKADDTNKSKPKKIVMVPGKREAGVTADAQATVGIRFERLAGVMEHLANPDTKANKELMSNSTYKHYGNDDKLLAQSVAKVRTALRRKFPDSEAPSNVRGSAALPAATTALLNTPAASTATTSTAATNTDKPNINATTAAPAAMATAIKAIATSATARHADDKRGVVYNAAEREKVVGILALLSSYIRRIGEGKGLFKDQPILSKSNLATAIASSPLKAWLDDTSRAGTAEDLKEVVIESSGRRPMRETVRRTHNPEKGTFFEVPQQEKAIELATAKYKAEWLKARAAKPTAGSEGTTPAGNPMYAITAKTAAMGSADKPAATTANATTPADESAAVTTATTSPAVKNANVNAVAANPAAAVATTTTADASAKSLAPTTSAAQKPALAQKATASGAEDEKIPPYEPSDIDLWGPVAAQLMVPFNEEDPTLTVQTQGPTVGEWLNGLLTEENIDWMSPLGKLGSGGKRAENSRFGSFPDKSMGPLPTVDMLGPARNIPAPALELRRIKETKPYTEWATFAESVRAWVAKVNSQAEGDIPAYGEAKQSAAPPSQTIAANPANRPAANVGATPAATTSTQPPTE